MSRCGGCADCTECACNLVAGAGIDLLGDGSAGNSWIISTEAALANDCYLVTSPDFMPLSAPNVPIGDGSSRPLSTYYGSLAAAQARYPHATSLTNELAWAAIQLAINTASTNGAVPGGVVCVPPGVYLVNRQIQIKPGVVLRGGSMHSTWYRASAATWPANTPMVRIGDGTSVGGVYDTRLENAFLDCNHVATGGVYSTEAQENSGCLNVEVFLSIGHMYHFSGGGTQNFRLEHIFGGMSETVDGQAFSGLWFDACGVGEAHYMTFIGGEGAAAGAQIADAVRIDGGSVATITQIHAEDFTSCVTPGAGGSATVIGAYGHSSLSYVCAVAGAALEFVGLNIVQLGAPITILDNKSGQSVTDVIVGLYTSGVTRLAQDVYLGGDAAYKITRTLTGTKTWDPANVADGAMTSTTVTVTFAALGDVATAAFSQAVPAGCILTASVTAANTVTVTLFNKSGGAVDLASGTLRADVMRH